MTTKSRFRRHPTATELGRGYLATLEVIVGLWDVKAALLSDSLSTRQEVVREEVFGLLGCFAQGSHPSMDAPSGNEKRSASALFALDCEP